MMQALFIGQIVAFYRGDLEEAARLGAAAMERYDPERCLWHTARLEVKPGLTGLWQVSGRGELDFDDRLRLDLAYIDNRCLSLDVRILFRTVRAVGSTKGAV